MGQTSANITKADAPRQATVRTAFHVVQRGRYTSRQKRWVSELLESIVANA